MIIKRRRFRQETSLQDRIVEWAVALRKQADVMRPGPERDELLKKLRQAETAMHMEDWANSRGLQPPNRNDRSPSLIEQHHRPRLGL